MPACAGMKKLMFAWKRGISTISESDIKVPMMICDRRNKSTIEHDG